MTHVNTKTHTAPTPQHHAAPKAKHDAPPAVHVAKDSNRVTKGLSLSKAKTQPLQALPWEPSAHGPALDPWMGALREGFLSAWRAPAPKKPADPLAGLKGKLTKGGFKALQTLESDHKLGQNWGGKSLLKRVRTFLKDGGSGRLESHLLKQVADPDSITQMRPDSCAAATMQVTLAKQNPTKYMAVMNSLVKHGKATLHGQTLQVSAENRAEINKMGLKGQDKLNALFQSAAMELANGAHASYDFQHDTTTVKTTGKHHHQQTDTEKGLTMGQATTLDKDLGLTPVMQPSTLHAAIAQGEKAGLTRAQAAEQTLGSELASAQGGNHPGLLVAVKDNHHKLAHMVLVKGIVDGNVQYVDGHHHAHTVPLDEFAHRLCTNEHDRVGSGITFGQSGPTTGYAPPTSFYGAPTTTMPWMH